MFKTNHIDSIKAIIKKWKNNMNNKFMDKYKDISFTSDGFFIYKGVKLQLTRENIQDYEIQTELSAIEIIEWTYNNSISVIRDKKLEELLS